MLDQDDRTTDFDSPVDASEDYADTSAGVEPHGSSLAEDLVALFEDGKTYAQAEVAFQKSRASYTADRLKGALAFGLGAFGLLLLALIALTVGLVIALMPLVGPWLATGIVTLALIIGGVVLLRMLKARVDDIRAAFSDKPHD